MIKVKKIISGNLYENCYIVYDSKNLHAIIIDPGEDGDKIIFEVDKKKFKLELLINTHGHYDHISSDDKIRSRFKIPLAIHKDEVAMLSDISKNGSKIFGTPIIIKPPEILLEDNKNVQLSFTSFRVIHTSGHTIGSICLLFNDFLITGDTLFAGTIGRTDLDGGSYDDIMAAISKLKKLEPHLIIYPGHGSITTLINELHHNPYLQD